MEGSKILSASLLLYGVPLILLLAGIFIGLEMFYINKELYSSLFAIGLASIYVFFMLLFTKKDKEASYPVIVFVSSSR